MTNLSKRSTLPELMDDPEADPAITRRSLEELIFINTYLGGYTVILNALQSLKPKLKALDRDYFRVVDLGCGSGDALRKIADWAKRQNMLFEGIGVDRNPVMVECAGSLSKDYPNLSYRTQDVWHDAMFELKPDIVLNSLFCHHFDDAELVLLVERMYRLAGTAVIINDLQRHPLAYYSIKYLTQALSKSSQVRYDAPLSVARSLTRPEWKSVLKRARVDHYSLHWMWAFRWQLILEKTE